MWSSSLSRAQKLKLSVPAALQHRCSQLKISPHRHTSKQHCYINQRRAMTTVSSTYQPASAHVAAFRKIIGEENVMTEAFDIEKYTVDWTKVYRGGTVVCFPRSTKNVSDILRFCNSNKIGVVPQGGNTGLVGGAVGTPGVNNDQLIMSMEKMSQIMSIEESVLVCEAGCILENLNTEAGKKGYVVPLDLGSKGNCMIGGNVATNAGGLRVIRYGTLHGTVLGLEVVQADGTVLDMLRTLRKDNCGYHLSHLYIGSEGTLGVITKVAIALALKPNSTAVVWAKVSSFAVVPALLHRARAEVGEVLSAFEFLDGASIEAIRRASPHLLHRVQESVLPAISEGKNEAALMDVLGDKGTAVGIAGEICVLMEFSSCSSSSGSGGVEGRGSSESKTEGGEGGNTLTQRLESFLEGLVEDEMVIDAVVSRSSEHESELWAIREQLPVCLMHLSRAPEPSVSSTVSSVSSVPVDAAVGVASDSSIATRCIRLCKYDVSIALKDTSTVVAMVRKQMAREMEGRVPEGVRLEYCCFGHAGDQNLHLNVLLHYPLSAPSEGLEGGLEEVKKTVHTALDRAVFKAVLSVKGSVSAEHGVGQQKRSVMNVARSPPELTLMAGLKRTLDPNGILNPGKVLPDGY